MVYNVYIPWSYWVPVHDIITPSLLSCELWPPLPFARVPPSCLHSIHHYSLCLYFPQWSKRYYTTFTVFDLFISLNIVFSRCILKNKMLSEIFLWCHLNETSTLDCKETEAWITLHCWCSYNGQMFECRKCGLVASSTAVVVERAADSEDRRLEMTQKRKNNKWRGRKEDYTDCEKILRTNILAMEFQK